MPWHEHPGEKTAVPLLVSFFFSFRHLTQVLWSRDAKIFEAALARIGEVSPEVAEYEAAAKSYDLETARQPAGRAVKRPAAEPAGTTDAASEPCTAPNDSP